MAFDWITDDLALGGRIEEAEVAALARDHGIAAVVDLRGEACDDEALLRYHGLLHFLHLPTPDLAGVTQAMLRRGVAFVAAQLDVGRRTLVHCEFGIGRSALLALCVLVERGRAPLEALALAKDRRAAVSPSPAQFEAWASWLRDHRAERDAAWTVPTFEDFAAIAYRHLASSRAC